MLAGPSGITVRAETSADVNAIGALINRAFAPMPFASGNEANIVERLRAEGGLALSLTATGGQGLVAYVAFSPAIAASGVTGWYTLGPVAVEPSVQKTGIGSLLISAGLDSLRGRGGKGCIVVGDPAYYARFGFVSSPESAPARELAAYFMTMCFGAAAPKDRFAFHPAFD